MWVDPTRKYFFSFINKDFKIELSMKILAVVAWLAIVQLRLVPKSWAYCSPAWLRSTVTNPLARSNVRTKPFPSASAKRDDFVLAILFKLQFQFIAVLGLCLVGKFLTLSAQVFDGFNWVLVELAIFDG